MKILILIAVFFIKVNSYGATNEIVVLTSLKPQKKQHLLHFRKNIKKYVDTTFSSALKLSPTKLVIKHKATVEDLDFYLNSDATLALFWISHAAGPKQAPGIGSYQGVILDEYNMTNIAPIFQKINSNIRFLAIISCGAKPLIDEYIKKGYYKDNPNLNIKTFNSNISLKKGIYESFKHLHSKLGDGSRFKQSRSTKVGTRRKRQNKIAIIIDKKYLKDISNLKKEKDNIEFKIIKQTESANPIYIFTGSTLRGMLYSNTKEIIIKVPKILIKKRFRISLKTQKIVPTPEDIFPIPQILIEGIRLPLASTPYLNENGSIAGRDTNIYYIDFNL